MMISHVDGFPLYGASDKETDYIIDEQSSHVFGSNKQPLTEIPFTFVGSLNNDSTVDDSPLYPLAGLNLAHYRNSADYEQSSFVCGQPTLVLTGLTDQWAKDHINGKILLGSSSGVVLGKDADAKLLQPDENSMPIEAMKHKEDQMKSIGAKLIEPGQVQRTATEAEIESTSESSVLSSIAKNVSAAYEQAFYFCSLFGEEVNKDDISIELNSEFQITALNAAERAEVMKAMQGGLLTFGEAREVYRRKDIATLDDDEAQAIINGSNIAI
jgi:hypothetical protein